VIRAGLLLALAALASGAAAGETPSGALRHDHGGGRFLYGEGERFEYRSNEGDPLLEWDGEGWYGGDIAKFWVKSEAEYDFDADEFAQAEVQALYSRAIGRYFDFQGGVRRDFGAEPGRTHAVLGVKGLAPYMFELDAALFVSGHGEVTARIETEYDLLLTQRLILQPRTELAFSAQDVAELGLGAGLSTAELGLRLRYEIRRRVAPYVGLAWTRDVGATADFTRAAGEDPGAASFVAGLKFWF
jgi:copper resistance protein B